MDAAHPGTRFRVRQVAETGSTNADVAAAAAAGEPEGLVLVADHQTAGRGRLDRTWVAPAGSALLTSILLRPPAGLAPLAVAAVACAAVAACGDQAALKWPNDLVGPDGRKLAGILAEAAPDGALTVGLGLNLHTSADLPADVAARAVALDQVGGGARDGVLAELLSGLEARYAGLLADGPATLLAEYRRRCVTPGQRVRVEAPGETWEGQAVGVTDQLALEVDRSGAGKVVVHVGDIIHLRPV